jgi:hypothetical protein
MGSSCVGCYRLRLKIRVEAASKNHFDRPGHGQVFLAFLAPGRRLPVAWNDGLLATHAVALQFIAIEVAPRDRFGNVVQ